MTTDPTGGEFFSLDPEEVAIAFGVPAPQSRATVAFRAVLVIPQLIVMAVFGLVALLLVVAGWFAALVLGRLPRTIAEFETGWIAYQARVKAYLYLLLDDYPPFDLGPASYPIRVDVGASHLSRVKVLFRWLLLIPAGIVSAVATTGLLVFSPVLWIVTLVLGRTPQTLFSAAAAVIRYEARYYAYFFLITDEYPRRLFGDWDSEWSEDDVRLRLSEGTKRVLVLIVILGIAGTIANVALRPALNLRRGDPLDAITAQFAHSSDRFRHAVDRCGAGPQQFRCYERAERTWSLAWDRFGSEISPGRFVSSQQAAAAAVVLDAHAVARALRVASSAKTDRAHLVAYDKVTVAADRFDRDLHLFGVKS